MKVIRDSDVVEFVDDSGDKLILLECPRQRDVMRGEDLASEEAIAGLSKIKALGMDTDKMLADAQANPETFAAAQSNVETTVPPKVRRFRLEVLGIRLVVGGESFGGKAVLEQYDDMARASAAWVDEKVSRVWDGATPDDASARG